MECEIKYRANYIWRKNIFSGATLQANAITATSFTSSTAPAGNDAISWGGTLTNLMQEQN
jgi:hypothetical protein